MSARSSPLGWRRRLVLGIALMTVLAASATALLPVLTGSAGDVRHSYTAELPVENRGAYLITERGAMQLYPWEIVLDNFPSDAPTLPEITAIAVVARVLAPPERYVLYDLDRGRTAPWADVTSRGSHLELDPGPIVAGRYLFVAPADSSFGGTVHHYFTIAADHDEEVIP